jgi:hypothetical protein
MTRRRRMLLGALLIASLLFQQVAVAAYACAHPVAAPAMPAGMEHCARMDAAPAPVASSPLCEKHCTPDQSLLTDTAVPGVPTLALPPAYSLVLVEPVSHVAQQVEVPIVRSDPPPRLRYCSLLI